MKVSAPFVRVKFVHGFLLSINAISSVYCQSYLVFTMAWYIFVFTEAYHLFSVLLHLLTFSSNFMQSY